MVKELADGNMWKKVSVEIGANPEVIYRNRVPREKQVEYSEELVRKIIPLGYNDGFGWSTYIKAFKKTG